MKRALNLETEHFDVLIVGAGLSGIGCACALTQSFPDLRIGLIEARNRIGGTWDLFRYPGIRSDSDLYTFSYDFKPWTKHDAIASGGDILDYLDETVAEYDLQQKITFSHRVVGANWNSAEAMWEVSVQSTLDPEAQPQKLRCRWLYGASGYYDYDEGFSPTFKNQNDFAGQIVHPQHWPQDLDYAGRRIVMIGSGATAVTLLPELAQRAAHVVQVQRSPTYVVARPKSDKLALLTNRLLPAAWAHRLNRYRYILFQRYTYLFCQRFPKLARRLIRSHTRKHLPAAYPVDVDFNPPYDPWDQRLCAAPDGDFFDAISNGSASICTAGVDSFTKDGVRLSNGQTLEADIIITATGLKLRLFGGIDLRIDGDQINTAGRYVYKGLMLDGVPNFCFAVGYTNSSWTLKVGLLNDHFCRVLRHMQDRDLNVCVPRKPTAPMPSRPLLDFGAGYVKRAIPFLPKQGDRYPWQMTFSYFSDAKLFRRGRVDAPELQFSSVPRAPSESSAA
jgi:cation diffusion facilitator CzcD-associated flavoprotein CzcO